MSADEPILTETTRGLVRKVSQYRSVLRAVGVTDPDTFEDYSDCPAYRSDGVCRTGCWTEPICQVNEPQGGWPIARVRAGLSPFPVAAARTCAICSQPIKQDVYSRTGWSHQRPGPDRVHVAAPVLAQFCGAEHPLDPATLYSRLASVCDGTAHSADGTEPWADRTEEDR